MCCPLFLGVLFSFLFCYALFCVHSSFAVILKRKRKLVILLLLPYRCIVTIDVVWLFLTVPWVGLQFVIVVFPDHTHFLYNTLDSKVCTLNALVTYPRACYICCFSSIGYIRHPLVVRSSYVTLYLPHSLQNLGHVTLAIWVSLHISDFLLKIS